MRAFVDGADGGAAAAEVLKNECETRAAVVLICIREMRSNFDHL